VPKKVHFNSPAPKKTVKFGSPSPPKEKEDSIDYDAKKHVHFDSPTKEDERNYLVKTGNTFIEFETKP
jgi:hypothetical protein